MSDHPPSKHCVSQPSAPLEFGPLLPLSSAAGGWRARVHQVPAATDNLCWLIEYAPQRVALVDGPSALEVSAYLNAHQLTLTHVLNTHTHGDHIGVNHALAREGSLEGVEVWASASAPIEVPGLTRALRDGEALKLGELEGFVWLTEGHLNGHISFVWGASLERASCEEPQGFEERPLALFCGDTLFTGGCGYVFDGPMSVMAESLCKLASLPPSTLVCCAHEYTLDNLHFALSLEGEALEGEALEGECPKERAAREALKERALEVSALRAEGKSAVPSQLGLERLTNPLLRAALRGDQGVSFERVRRLKDSRAYRQATFEATLEALR